MTTGRINQVTTFKAIKGPTNRHGGGRVLRYHATECASPLGPPGEAATVQRGWSQTSFKPSEVAPAKRSNRQTRRFPGLNQRTKQLQAAIKPARKRIPSKICGQMDGTRARPLEQIQPSSANDLTRPPPAWDAVQMQF